MFSACMAFNWWTMGNCCFVAVVHVCVVVDDDVVVVVVVVVVVIKICSSLHRGKCTSECLAPA